MLIYVAHSAFFRIPFNAHVELILSKNVHIRMRMLERIHEFLFDWVAYVSNTSEILKG